MAKTHFINPVKTKPERYGPMMLADGEFLCAKCVKENAALIDAAAADPAHQDSWACVGYCGDRVPTDTVTVRERTGGTRRVRLKVNDPNPKEDHCSHCGGSFSTNTDRIWLGVVPGGGTIFRCRDTPTRESHGDKYNATIGPFPTLQGAKAMLHFGRGNPHMTTVAQAEYLAKRHKDEWNLAALPLTKGGVK